ncbi:MAG: glycosyltransferase [Parachlamydiales bacterium]|nr:glycosyltransferase [Parachlamydiales bacterium]
MKTALIHDWFVQPGGAEKVLFSLHKLFPAPLYFLFADLQRAQAFFPEEILHTSYLQTIYRFFPYYRFLLPLYPHAVTRWNLREYDLIISSSHAVAKGVKKLSHQMHICYCHTPMRYAWDLFHTYFRNGWKSVLASGFFSFFRQWDRKTADQVDFFVANSQHVRQRILKTYSKDAVVIYPPVDVDFFALEKNKEDFYMTASRLVSYKKVDLIVEAFLAMPEKKLIVIGDGPERKKIEAKIQGNISFLGYQSDERLRFWLQKAKAFVFAAEEDFGILPVEAQCTGTPVIAYKKGGALETVVDNETGIFFDHCTKEDIINAVHRFETMDFDPVACHTHAQKFSTERFCRHFSQFVSKCVGL